MNKYSESRPIFLTIHKLLIRQLKRNGLSQEQITLLSPLFTAISQAYDDADADRDLLERTLNTVSAELEEKNRDLSRRIEQIESAYDALEQSTAALNGLLNATGEAILSLNIKGHISSVNNTAVQALGEIDIPTDQSFYPVFRKFLRLTLNPSVFLREVRRLVENPHEHLYGTVELADKRLFEYHSSPQKHGDKLVGRVWCFRDVTQIKKNEVLVEHLAFHDALTDLPNRVLMRDRLHHATSLATRLDVLVAVLFVDLDHFKKVNDTAGHHYGDDLLKEVAKRIQNCLRDHDTLARFGGDEFVILLENLKTHSTAAAIANRIIETLSQPYFIRGKTFHISCSIGVTLYPKDDTSPEELIRKADLAMYHAKDRGRNNFQFFNSALERLAHFHMDLENRLRDAIKESQFYLVYQPQVDTQSGYIVGMEALIRWKTEDGKMVSPAEFIPMAERIGLIAEIDQWVMGEVYRQVKCWLDQGLTDFVVSINLSANQMMRANLVDEIKKLHTDFQIPGNYICLEITESMLMTHLDQAIETLKQIRGMGLSVAIDDFGTGYSSLQYLQRLPVDSVKIDRSFIRDFEQNSNNQTIVNAIINLGHNLRLEVTAEGVEEQSTVAFLQNKRCDLIQGYFFFMPLKEAEMTKLLNHRSVDKA